MLSPLEWDFITRTYKFLEPFVKATVIVESSYAILSYSLLIINVLLQQYKKYKVSSSPIINFRLLIYIIGIIRIRRDPRCLYSLLY